MRTSLRRRSARGREAWGAHRMGSREVSRGATRASRMVLSSLNGERAWGFAELSGDVAAGTHLPRTRRGEPRAPREEQLEADTGHAVRRSVLSCARHVPETHSNHSAITPSMTMARPLPALDPSEAKELERAASRLSQVPAGSDPVQILDAIPSGAGVEAGMLAIFDVGNPHAISNRPLRLPLELLEGWLATAPDHFASALAPAVDSPEGAFWRESDTVMTTSRAGLHILRELDKHGLGQGAGYKVMAHRTPGRGTDHTFLALMTRRGKQFPARAPRLLAELQSALRNAICRLSLPLIPAVSILRQIVEDDEQGYLCLSSSFAVMEMNRRAYDIALLYQTELRLDRRSHLLEDLAMRVAGVRNRVLQAMRRDKREVLEIRAHHLAKETHALPEDVTLLVLRTLEIPAPEVALSEHPDFAILTPAQRRVADLMINSGLSTKEIASEMGIAQATARTHVQNLYRRLRIRSRPELMMKGRSPGRR